MVLFGVTLADAAQKADAQETIKRKDTHFFIHFNICPDLREYAVKSNKIMPGPGYQRCQLAKKTQG